VHRTFLSTVLTFSIDLPPRREISRGVLPLHYLLRELPIADGKIYDKIDERLSEKSVSKRAFSCSPKTPEKTLRVSAGWALT
jgi:hypothetical protein